MFKWQTETQIRQAILRNILHGRHHYHGIPPDSEGGYDWIQVRIDLRKQGLIERDGEHGLARCHFHLTDAGVDYLARQILGKKAEMPA